MLNLLFVSIETPFNDTNPKILKRNIKYTALAIKDAITNYGDVAFSPYLRDTKYVEESGIVSDIVESRTSYSIPETTVSERKADKVVFYIDFGYSSEMQLAKNIAISQKIQIEERTLLVANNKN